jgi:hypothetical protein
MKLLDAQDEFVTSHLDACDSRFMHSHAISHARELGHDRLAVRFVAALPVACRHQLRAILFRQCE